MSLTPKIHLYQNNIGRTFHNGVPGAMANTRCEGNFTNYQTTRIPAEVTCRNCLRKIPRRLHYAQEPVVETTVPRARVEAIAANIRELFNLKAHQGEVQAKLVRYCVSAVRRADDPPSCNSVRGAVTQLERSNAIRKLKADKARALLYLERLATQMENNASGNLTETPDAP